ISPTTANVTNQTAIMGPNRKPTAPLPRLCIEKRQTNTTAAIGTTYGVTIGDTMRRPSTALNTDMAGVIMASPKNSDAQVRFADDIVDNQRLTSLERLPWHGARIGS